MNKFISLFIFFYLFLFGTKLVQGQSIIASAGSFDSNGTTQLSWTLGETLTETYLNGNSILEQGFNHTFKIATAVKGETDANFSIEAFPNPVIDILNLKVTESKPVNLVLAFFDLTGRELFKKPLINEVTEVPLASMAPSVYLIKIFDGSQGIKAFKIIKQ